MYDIHTHFIPSNVLDWLQDNKKLVNAKWVDKAADQAAFLSVNGNWEFELKEAFTNPQLYLAEQENAGILHSLVSPIPQLFLYDFAPEVTLELAQVYNDSLTQWKNHNTERLSSLATLPMNAPDQAAAELERAMNQGMKGAIVASSWSGRVLTEAAFIPFWEAANARNAIVFIHPLLNEDSRLKHHMMPNLIGVPWETTVCATDLLLSGILTRYPHVKILLAHGGGFLPYQLGRMTKGYNHWKAVAKDLHEPPEQACKRFWYDSVLWDSKALQYLIDTVGEDRVVSGTDYPFDLCEWPPAQLSDRGFQSLMNE